MRDRIQNAVTGIVHPNIDAAKAGHGERNHPIDFPPVPDVAGQGQRVLGMTDAAARGFGSPLASRESRTTLAP